MTDKKNKPHPEGEANRAEQENRSGGVDWIGSDDDGQHRADRSPRSGRSTRTPRDTSRPAGRKNRAASDAHRQQDGKGLRRDSNDAPQSHAGSRPRRDRSEGTQRHDGTHKAETPPRTHPAPARSATLHEPIRLNKAIASAGICSRRAADDLIAQGAVAVNGKTVDTPGVKVLVGKDVVTVNGVSVNLGVARQEFTYLVLNKPVRVVTTVNDPQGRTTVLDLLPQEIRSARLYPVGRLDFFSEGLLLLTDDGELTYRLTHPKWHLPKVYRVRVRGSVSDAALRTMRSGMTLSEGETLAPIKVNVLRQDNGATTLEMHLFQGVNRQIRRMCRDLDLTILSLRRFRHGPIDLGNLERGKFRFLDENEVAMLRRATGLE